MFYLGNSDDTWSDSNRNSGDSNAKFRCTVCPYTTSHKYSMMRHAAVHTGERPFVCNMCHQRFPRKDNLKRHIYTVHGKKI